MTETAKALYRLWSSFGIPAYPEYHVPDDATLPYITYEVGSPHWKGQTSHHARVWYRDMSYTAINAKLDEISTEIGDGLTVKTDNGMIAIFKDDAFIQFQPYEDETEVKVAYLSLILQAYT